MFGLSEIGINEQIAVNIIWFIFDIFIIITYFKFGFRESKFKSKNTFYTWSIIAILSSLIVQYLFIHEFGLILGSSYIAFLQNLLMSVLFIDLLHKRQSSEGQSMLIAVSKCLGTVAPTILFGYIGIQRLGGPNDFILVMGFVILVFDLAYIFLLRNKIKSEKK